VGGLAGSVLELGDIYFCTDIVQLLHHQGSVDKVSFK
jgi:hypothetical protein